MTRLSDPLSTLPRIGKSLPAFTKLGITTVRDLLFYFPYKYLDFRKTVTIRSARIGDIVTIRGHVKKIGSRYSVKSRMSLCEAIITDDTGLLKVTWFHQPYITETLPEGTEVVLSGKLEYWKGLQLLNPIYEIPHGETIHTGRLVPVYRLPNALYPKTIRNILHSIIPLASYLPDDLPETIRSRYNLANIGEAIMQVHFPEDDEQLKKGKVRILTNQLISQQLALQLYQHIREQKVAPKIKANISAIKKDLLQLPFTLTNDQKRALWEIVQDLETGKPMQRLLLGDVGSGKTVVAFLAAVSCIRKGVQVALLAPTEILAQQHFANLQKLSTKFSKSISCGLFTQSDQRIDKEATTKVKIKKTIGDGSINLIIGTHALLQEDIQFKSLGLVIIDEQHRFGVEQRGALLSKQGKNTIPHLLSMTATPIPRSLALSWYQDLPVSIIKQLPSGRQPIITRLVHQEVRETMYQHITQEIKAGRQAFVVLPRVEETETDDTKSVKDEFAILQKRFPQFKLGMIYGKMKGKDKDTLMQEMAQGSIDLLVASSVIEIGIDIPNASVMVIENAEHFGLAQLHQLRGRIGRGEHKSYCYVTTSDAQTQSERLNAFANITDGFKLAEMDLKQRGFGNLFGKEQSGFTFNFNDEMSLEALKTAGDIAKELLSVDETLQTFPQLADKALPLLKKLHLE